MATNLQLDETLISEAQKLGKQPSKRATVEMALREYVQRRQQLKIVESFGQIDYDESYDYKAARRTRRK
ncbi:MAG TPA: type II toxin-antitoxin system VapB family antitoxin [Opitutaceae bacterium]|nr:type II toxin-antitoxin system VapB family antitoxin [Opitutaceae bacterium]